MIDVAHHIPKEFATGAADILRIEKYGGGHINDTFLATTLGADGMPKKFVFQRINQNVFPDVPSVMENIVRVTEHLKKHIIATGESEPERRALSVICTHDGAPFHIDDIGNFWRAYPFIERTRWVDVVTSPDQARSGALAFGEFARRVSDLPGAPLHVTIPRFHDTPHRFRTLLNAIGNDPAKRVAGARKEIDFALSCEVWHDKLDAAQKSGAVPDRIAHNDTKINNVLFDIDSGEGICVLDLDTVMPGSALHDFGDLVRTAAATAPEDERDHSRIGVSLPVFEALASGFLEACGEVLTPAEIDLLAFSGRLMSFEVGIRFLTDHLLGDTYFRVHHEGHNLQRAKAQFRLVQILQEAEDEMAAAVSELTPSLRRSA